MSCICKAILQEEWFLLLGENWKSQMSEFADDITLQRLNSLADTYPEWMKLCAQKWSVQVHQDWSFARSFYLCSFFLGKSNMAELNTEWTLRNGAGHVWAEFIGLSLSFLYANITKSDQYPSHASESPKTCWNCSHSCSDFLAFAFVLRIKHNPNGKNTLPSRTTAHGPVSKRLSAYAGECSGKIRRGGTATATAAQSSRPMLRNR